MGIGLVDARERKTIPFSLGHTDTIILGGQLSFSAYVFSQGNLRFFSAIVKCAK